MHIELTGEQVIAEIVPKLARFIAGQSARGGRTHVNQGRHQIPGSGVKVGDIMHLSIDSAVNGMNQPIPQSATGTLQKGSGKNSFPPWHEGDINGIVHPAGHHVFDQTCSIRPATKQMGSFGHQLTWFRALCPDGRCPRRRSSVARRLIINLLGKRPFAPIDKTVEPQVGAMQIVGTTG